MMYWLESVVRGGVASGLEYRAAKANNIHVPRHDPSKPNSYIMVHGVNNLHGKALCSFLPTKDCKWFEKEQLEEVSQDPKSFVERIPEEGKFGCFLFGS